MIELRVLSGDLSFASAEYISPQDELDFERSLRSSNVTQYLRYLTYKIVHYIQVYYGPTIQEGVFEWLRDDSDDYYFINAAGVTYTEGQVFHISDEAYYKTLE